jgi:Uma2 family endonuclease
MSSATVKLMTAAEFAELPDDDRPRELVRGEVVYMNMPFPRHGQICARMSYLLQRHMEDHTLGHVVTNDSGVITERDPDTVRGADVAYYSYTRVPPGPFPRRAYLPVVPEIVFEVRSPGDRWREIEAKVHEYLQAGVTWVCVVDDPTERAYVFHTDDVPQFLTRDQDLTFPDILPDFRVAVRRFFE